MADVFGQGNVWPAQRGAAGLLGDGQQPASRFGLLGVGLQDADGNLAQALQSASIEAPKPKLHSFPNTGASGDTDGYADASAAKNGAQAGKGVTVILGYKPIDGAPFADHSYVKIIGSDGREFFLRGGLGEAGPSSGLPGESAVLGTDSSKTRSIYSGHGFFAVT